jgi:DNA invertase Pin-like site-specific DNA recombinase
MPRAIGYIRVSTNDQAKEGGTVGSQRARIEAWCLTNNASLDPADVFIEGEDSEGGEGKGVSGSKVKNRPALKAALDLVCECKGVLVFYSLSRMARSLEDTLSIAKRLKKAGANMLSLREPMIDTTSATGKMIFRLLAVLAEFERDLTIERTTDALQSKIKKGERVGKIKYGSVIDPTDPRRSKKTGSPVALVAQPAEAEAIERMKLMKADGKSFRAIAEALTVEGIPTREGGERWHHSTVRKILLRA